MKSAKRPLFIYELMCMHQQAKDRCQARQSGTNTNSFLSLSFILRKGNCYGNNSCSGRDPATQAGCRPYSEKAAKKGNT